MKLKIGLFRSVFKGNAHKIENMELCVLMEGMKRVCFTDSVVISVKRKLKEWF